MLVTVNGVARQLASDENVIRVVRRAGVDPAERGVAVALDGEVVPRRDWETTALREGASVEIVRAAAGG